MTEKASVDAQQKTQEKPTSQTQRSAPRGTAKRWIAPALLLLVASGALGLWEWQQASRRRWKEEPILMPERTARVTGNWTARVLAERLKASRKLRDVPTFLAAAQQVGLTRAEPGGYALPAKAGPLQLAKIFSQPPSLSKVTFPEGWTAMQMSRRLAANKFAAAQEFKRLAYPASAPVSPLEGRLFPDTYLLPRRASAQQLAARLKDRFREAAAAMPTPLPKGEKGQRLSLLQAVTLASLVERETSVAAERPIVAGVLLNRLRKGMRLQCDASVQYARQRAAMAGALAPNDPGHKARLLWSDLKFPSPYNTYLHAGLPPGPICNPGQDALIAAALPRASPYFFYVMSPKLNRHRFARTFEEHKRNIRLAKAERGAMGKP